MTLYLTSNPFLNGGFNGANDFIFQLSRDWRGGNCLLMSADPSESENNDQIRNDFAAALNVCGLGFSAFDVCDYRFKEAADNLDNYSAIFLSGGHVPTQNKFFTDISLRKKIRSFNGLILGVSAGTMNCADAVYAIPELKGEARSKKYKRFINGLALTDINVIPHYYSMINESLDGEKVIYDIAAKDSAGRIFYGLPDGSYFIKRNGLTKLYGEAYIIKNGMFQRI